MRKVGTESHGSQEQEIAGLPQATRLFFGSVRIKRTRLRMLKI